MQHAEWVLVVLLLLSMVEYRILIQPRIRDVGLRSYCDDFSVKFQFQVPGTPNHENHCAEASGDLVVDHYSHFMSYSVTEMLMLWDVVCGNSNGSCLYQCMHFTLTDECNKVLYNKQTTHLSFVPLFFKHYFVSSSLCSSGYGTPCTPLPGPAGAAEGHFHLHSAGSFAASSLRRPGAG